MNRATAFTITRRAVLLSRRAADRGNLNAARKAWGLACWAAGWMGGICGYDARSGAILFPENLVAWAPVGCSMKEWRAAA